VFQDFRLLRDRTAEENVAFALEVTGTKRPLIGPRVNKLLTQVGLAHKARAYPDELSGGERQRVAVARALANRPLVLLADEPSGNLDPSTSDRLHEHLFRVCREEGAAMVLVTHDLALAARADRVLRLLGGQLVDAAPGAAGAAA
jgi:cell division transport system ATP-binding protein